MAGGEIVGRKATEGPQVGTGLAQEPKDDGLLDPKPEDE